MQFTEEDVQTTIDEIKQYLHCIRVEHVKNTQFTIWADFWTSDDFEAARNIGLDIQGVGTHYEGKRKISGIECDWETIEVDVDYIGKHRIVMG